MLVNERILEVSGKRPPKVEIKGLNINIAIEEVSQVGQELEITYTYHATYEDKAGDLKLRGVLTAKEDDKLTKEIMERWKKEKKLPDAYAEPLLGAINYSGSANGTLVARVLGLTAPLIPPRIQLGNKK